MGALELAQIGRLFDKSAVDDAGQANADRVHGLSPSHRSDLLGKTLRDSIGRQAEQRLVLRALLVDAQLADQLMPSTSPVAMSSAVVIPIVRAMSPVPTTSPVC